MRLAKRLAILGFDFLFGIVKGEQPLSCNGDDRRQWRIQGGAVGAAASRMRAAAKQTLGAATRRIQRVEIAGAFLVLFWHAKENLTPRNRALTRATSAQ